VRERWQTKTNSRRSKYRVSVNPVACAGRTRWKNFLRRRRPVNLTGNAQIGDLDHCPLCHINGSNFRERR
jgi:hypothetical protein